MPELRRSARVASKPAVVADAPEVSEPQKKKSKTVSAPKIATNGTKELQVGDKIPDITLFDEEDNEVSLKEAAQKTKYLIIFAYPKASTPGCTRQVCGFQKNFEFLQKSDATVFGLSADQPKSQKNFVVKQHLKYSLLSDPSKELIGILGAKKSPSGIKRSHWIFVDGVLRVKKIQISPEDSFNGAKIDIEKFIAETGIKNEDAKEETKEEVKEDEPTKEEDVQAEKEETKPEEKEEVKIEESVKVDAAPVVNGTEA